MAYTTKLIMELPSKLATAVKTYLDNESITTLHAVSISKVGQYVICLIVYE